MIPTGRTSWLAVCLVILTRTMRVHWQCTRRQRQASRETLRVRKTLLCTKPFRASSGWRNVQVVSSLPRWLANMAGQPDMKGRPLPRWFWSCFETLNPQGGNGLWGTTSRPIHDPVLLDWARYRYRATKVDAWKVASPVIPELYRQWKGRALPRAMRKSCAVPRQAAFPAE